PPTVEEATRFVADAEKTLLDLWISDSRAQWVQNNFITDDTDALAAMTGDALIGATMRLAKEATRFDGLQLPADVARKIRLLKV
ncbi:M2 family metallopeptidase, partial [Escherichia coli]